jgi:Uma2 family endonuclease
MEREDEEEIMAINPAKSFWTVEEYLAYEQETGFRFEFLNGKIFAVSWGGKKHSIIIYNINGELREQLRKSQDCQGYESNMRVKITDMRYVYPDLTVVCGDAVFADEAETMLTNPTLLVEVLSETTANYDKGQKYDYYRSLPSVQAYLMLEQGRAHAMLYTRDKTGWHLEEYSGLEAIVPLEAIGCNLAMSEAYLNIEFENE